MNKVYKSVWNESIGAWVAVSETAAARGKKSSGRARTPLGLSAIALAGASLGLPSTVTLAAENRAALFNDFTDGTCTAIYDGDTQHGTSIYTGAGCNPRLGNSGSATSIGLNGGGAGTNGTNLISNQSGAFINGGLEVFGSDVAAGSPAAYIHGGLSLFSNGTTSGTANKLIGVASGTQTNDAVNVSQVTPLVKALGGTTTFNADGSITAPTYKVKSATFNNVGDALTALDNKYLSANDAADSADGATAIGVGSIAIGGNAVADSTGGSHAAMAIGSDSKAGTQATALGPGATASVANSVALGTLSVADRAGTVSVGSATNKRQIVNVAAGTQANDAVNVTQLQNVTTLLGGGAKVNTDGTVQAPAYTVAGVSSGTVGDAITKIDSELTNKVAYDTTDKSHVTLGGVGTTKLVTLSNVAAGALTSSSTDAVNGSQLNSTNTRVGSLETFATNINNGGGIKYFHSNSQLADSSATGADAVAIGGAAVASADNSVAIGANSSAIRANSVSVGAAGKERQITNVAAGMGFTDAVNVAQLNALSDLTVKYDTNPNGSVNYQNVTLGGSGASKPTKLTNLSVADLSSSSTDAVNGSQLFATNQDVSTLKTFANNINNGGGIKYFHSNSAQADSSATGADAVAIGGSAQASANNSVALGANSVANRKDSVSVGAAGTANNAVAVGANASATANNAVALGAGSVADRANAVSVGTTAAGGQRQITNVAAGTDGTDAVNVNQMQQSVNTGVKSAKGYTDALRSDMNSGLSLANNHINSVGAMSSAMAMMAGSAAAIADKDNRFAAGTGVYRDKAAIAIGFQKRFGTNMVLTIGGSTTGEETTGGAGFAFGF